MIGCVIATDSEAEILLDQMEIENSKTVFGKTVHFGKAFGHDVVLVTCGVGKVNAAAGACAAIQTGADVLLNFGAAGGLNPETTEVGDVYLIEKAVQYDFDCTQLNGLPIGTLDGETENFLPLFCPPLPYPRRARNGGPLQRLPRRPFSSSLARVRHPRDGRRGDRRGLQVCGRTLCRGEGGLRRVRFGFDDRTVPHELQARPARTKIPPARNLGQFGVNRNPPHTPTPLPRRG